LSFKVELLEFCSTLQAEGIIDWLHDVERIFDYKEVLDSTKMKLVTIKLKGRTSTRWEQLKRSWDRQSKPKICDWKKMKKKMNTFYPLDRYMQTLFQWLHTLRQGARFVDDYTKKFYRFIAQNDLSEAEEELVV
jgi:hypothetical protein